MKKAIIIIVLLILVGCGVVGGMAVMGMGPLAAYLAAPDAIAEPLPASPPPPAARLIDMETMGIPVIDGNTVTARLFFNLQLDVVPDRAEEVRAIMPRLQSTFLQEMLVYLPRHLRDRKMVDAIVLQQHLTLVARKVAGNRIRGVVVKNYFEQN